jgi:hypothetical protein
LFGGFAASATRGSLDGSSWWDHLPGHRELPCRMSRNRVIGRARGAMCGCAGGSVRASGRGAGFSSPRSRIRRARAHSHSACQPAWVLRFGQFDSASSPRSYPRLAFRRGRRRESLS